MSHSKMSTNTRRVTFLIESLGIGGAERVVSNLATAFDGNGWAVDVVVTQERGPLERDLSDGVVVRSLDANRTLTSVPQFVEYLRDRRPDALVANMTHVNVVAAIAVRLARVDTTLAVVEHSMLSDRVERMDGRKEWLTAKLAGRVYPWADAIVTVSDNLAEDVATVTGVDRDSITTIYNPIVTDELFEQADESVTHEWFAGDGPPVVLTVGRLEVRKDLPTLLRAFRRLLERRACRLVICGDGPERESLETLVAELGIAEQVKFVGWADNPYKYMHRADAFVLSSFAEGFSNVLAEALAMGCPIVSTDCGGPAEILEEGTWGRLVPVGDEDALTTAIGKTLTESVDSDGLRQRADAFTTAAAYRNYAELLEGKS
ncbi:glycosyltransferase [Halobacteria archaeon AArc-m2/3/4]|uniref:Glycosyltransferase n=1 Tax=Natronoglomus mannanivorans TaxID=2979990 RepID=A0ABT2QJA3_9EURY|nr:glycosyltransferase [Halobacteria archaeon AArc-m2/3/4]